MKNKTRKFRIIYILIVASMFCSAFQCSAAPAELCGSLRPLAAVESYRVRSRIYRDSKEGFDIYMAKLFDIKHVDQEGREQLFALVRRIDDIQDETKAAYLLHHLTYGLNHSGTLDREDIENLSRRVDINSDRFDKALILPGRQTKIIDIFTDPLLKERILDEVKMIIDSVRRLSPDGYHIFTRSVKLIEIDILFGVHGQTYAGQVVNLNLLTLFQADASDYSLCQSVATLAHEIKHIGYHTAYSSRDIEKRNDVNLPLLAPEVSKWPFTGSGSHSYSTGPYELLDELNAHLESVAILHRSIAELRAVRPSTINRINFIKIEEQIAGSLADIQKAFDILESEQVSATDIFTDTGKEHIRLCKDRYERILSDIKPLLSGSRPAWLRWAVSKIKGMVSKGPIPAMAMSELGAVSRGAISQLEASI